LPKPTYPCTQQPTLSLWLWKTTWHIHHFFNYQWYHPKTAMHNSYQDTLHLIYAMTCVQAGLIVLKTDVHLEPAIESCPMLPHFSTRQPTTWPCPNLCVISPFAFGKSWIWRLSYRFLFFSFCWWFILYGFHHQIPSDCWTREILWPDCQ
jgi:hypothetical protein